MDIMDTTEKILKLVALGWDGKEGRARILSKSLWSSSRNNS